MDQNTADLIRYEKHMYEVEMLASKLEEELEPLIDELSAKVEKIRSYSDFYEEYDFSELIDDIIIDTVCPKRGLENKEKGKTMTSHEQKMNAVKEIMRFQSDRELDQKEYDALNEHINIIEELLESVNYDVPKEKRDSLMHEWAEYVAFLDSNEIIVINKNTTCSEHDIVDAYADIIVFAIGAIMKLGFDPELVLSEVAKEINSRAGRIINGKFEKFLPNEDGYKEPYKANYEKCRVTGGNANKST